MDNQPSPPVEDNIYLLSHSVGRPPFNSTDYLSKHYFQHWENEGNEVWPKWLEEIDCFRTTLGRLLNVQMQDLCPQTNLSSALTKILGSTPIDAHRNVIVYSQLDFPSMGFVLAQAVKAGYQLRCIPAELDILDLEVWEEYLGEDCAFVFITHVHSNTSIQVDVGGICQLANTQGILSIVDIAQSVGVVPIDIPAWHPDFVIGSCVKWLCGGPGAGFMWIDPERIKKCTPSDVGWWSHSNPFEFDIHHFDYADNALRFWGGTPSVLPFVLAANSIELISNIGADKIRQHNLELNQILLDQLPPEYCVTPSIPDQRGGTLVLDFGEHQSSVMDKLDSANVLYDARATGIRISPHFYNKSQEMDLVLVCLQL